MEEKKKILIITYYWPPSGGAGVQRISKFAKYLLQFGYVPFVITVDEKVASYPIVDFSLAKDADGSIKVFRTDSFEPLNILTRLTGNKAPYGGFANKDKGKFSQKVLRFIRGNFFIPDARKGWVRFAYQKAVELIEKESIRLVLISSPPHSSQLVGLKLKKKFPHLKWVADLRDPWTDIFYYKDMLHSKMAAAKDAAFERQVVEQADDLVVVSDPIRKSYLSKSDKVTPSKIHVLPNGYDEDDFPAAEEKHNTSFTITYVGTIADSYNPGIFFECLSQAIQYHPGQKIALRFVGGRTENILTSIRANNLEKITEFLPHVDHSTAIGYMRASDALLLVIPDVAGSEGILTGKLFEYLAARKPIVCIGPQDGDAARIIDECRAGQTFHRRDPEGLVNYLNMLMAEWRQRKLLTYESVTFEKYSRKNLTMQLSTIISGNANSYNR